MNIFNTIVQVLIALTTLSFPVWIIVGIVLLVKASSSEDLTKKKKIKKWGISTIVFPFVFMFLLLSIWGLVSIMTGTAIKQ